MIALVRFVLHGYVRSSRVLYALVPALLLVLVVLTQGPSGPDGLRLATGGLGDVPAFLFPLWAWTARTLIDTQPDGQRDLAALAVRRRHVADLAAALLANLVLGVLVLVVPMAQARNAGVPVPVMLTGLGLAALACAAATALGAWTARVMIPSPAAGLVSLLGLLTAAVLLGLGPLRRLAVPLLAWEKAAHDGTEAFTHAFPGIALHLVLWTAAVAGSYLVAVRTRP
ncbi:hypothetical protein BTM25_31310 [Actinomadura rubteroloni]|uniref:Uncharacterized protein n=1 Tax=Actinomadura rubteroloni TaxID=1926885 RepID=A0A2P4UHG9_9ACTN|nr:hypothetical protein [Actinomadura rubteroloni]POM24502.1 hypothetical protein BTM25_31310 [Actinomadura rubteroloni]